MQDRLLSCRRVIIDEHIALTAQVLIASLQLESFDVYMIAECLRLLEDSEVRVRLAVGTTLEALARKHGVSVFLQCRERVLHSIFSNFVSAGGRLE